MELPVYMITGFLESGKTSFILDTISDKQFSKGQRTLIIACEEGEVEYAPDILKAAKAEVEFIEDEETMGSMAASSTPAVKGMDDASQIPNLFKVFEKMGLSQEERDKIARLNFQAVVKKTIG